MESDKSARLEQRIEKLQLSQEFHRALGWTALEAIHGQYLQAGDVFPVPPLPGQSLTVNEPDGLARSVTVVNPLDKIRPTTTTKGVLDKQASTYANILEHRNARLSSGSTHSSTGTTETPFVPVFPKQRFSSSSELKSMHLNRRQLRAQKKLGDRILKIQDLEKGQSISSAIFGNSGDHSPLLARIRQFKTFREDRLALKEGTIDPIEYAKLRKGQGLKRANHTETISPVRVLTPAGFANIGKEITRNSGLSTDRVSTINLRAGYKKAYQSAIKPNKYRRTERKIQKLQEKLRQV